MELTKGISLFHKILLASPLVVLVQPRPPQRSRWITEKIPPLFTFFLSQKVGSRFLGSFSFARSLHPISTCSSPSLRQTSNTLKLIKMVQSPVKSSPSKRPLGSSPAKQESPLKRLHLNDQQSPIKRSRNEETSVLYFVKITDKAHQPTKGSKLAAGYDLKSAYEYVVPARGSCLVKTDIQIKLPAGNYGRIAPRSGLALKNKIDVGAGVIDEDYRGPVGVILFNHGDEDFKVNEGDRIAQLICEKISYPEIVEVKDLDDTERGEGGFGSTGVGNEKAKMDTSV